MKRFAIIAILIVAVAAFVLVPLLRNNGGEVESGFPASFNFEENLATDYGKVIPIAFTVNSDEVKTVELIYNDSVFQTWTAPKGVITFPLDADYFGVGTRMIILRSTLNDGNVEEDTRMLRVLSDISPKPVKLEVVQAYPHDQTSYTQGLEFSDGQLYEGTGNPQNGAAASMVGKIDFSNGKIITKNGLDASYFGEGITILGDELFQLTWKNGKCFVYDKNSLQVKLKEFTYTGEGWGLCNDGTYLIMSDGTERIVFRDPKTFNIVRTIEVYDNVGPRVGLNELEYINGMIYANVYTTDIVIVIEPLSGKVMEEIDASALAATGKMGGEVLNGIAYNKATNKLYMTGKYWGKLMEVKPVE